MKRIVLAVGAVSLLAMAGAALAEDYSKQGRAVSKMISNRGSGPAVPTGIDVPGCAHYELTPSGKVRQYCDLSNFNRPGTLQQFWEERARRGTGGDGSGGGDGGGSGQ